MQSTPPPNGWEKLEYGLYVALLMLGCLWAVAIFTGCIKSNKTDAEFVGPPYIAGDSTQKVDAHDSLITAKMLEDARIQIRNELRAEFKSEIAAQINHVQGNQTQNSTLALVALIVWPGILQLADKLSRRSKTLRKIDAAVKGQPRVTVNDSDAKGAA